MDRQKNFVLSTVGISVLLNSLDQNDRGWRLRLNQEANSRQPSSEVATKTEELASRALETLLQGDVLQNRNLSAELNGLYALYNDRLDLGQRDMHFLIATDTALGRKAAKVVQEFLRKQGFSVDTYVPHELSTDTPQAFSRGIKELLHWCEQTIPGYHQSGYRVVFNLTGAFKSLQGYLNIVGMFYADEIAYIFETGRLLSIPRLPLQVDVGNLRDYRVELALMAQGHIYTEEQVSGIPDGLLEVDDRGCATLSDWGILVWNRVRQELLAEDLLPFPRLQYTDNFRRDFKQASPRERAELQETLARVSSLLEEHDGNTAVLKKDGGLQYEVYTNRKTSDGRPIGHFRVSQSRRISCTTEAGALRLRRYGEHSVNDNP